MSKLTQKQEGTLAIIAALLVLFSAMWNSQVSLIISVAALVLFAVYKFLN